MQDWTPFIIAAAASDKIKNDNKIADQQREQLEIQRRELEKQHKEQLELFKQQEIKEEFNSLMNAINFNTTSVNPNFEIEEEYWNQLQTYIKDKNKLEKMVKYFTKNFQKKLELDKRERELNKKESNINADKYLFEQEKSKFEQTLIKEKEKINNQLRQEFCSTQVATNEMLKKEEQELIEGNYKLEKERANIQNVILQFKKEHNYLLNKLANHDWAITWIWMLGFTNIIFLVLWLVAQFA